MTTYDKKRRSGYAAAYKKITAKADFISARLQGVRRIRR